MWWVWPGLSWRLELSVCWCLCGRFPSQPPRCSSTRSTALCSTAQSQRGPRRRHEDRPEQQTVLTPLQLGRYDQAIEACAVYKQIILWWICILKKYSEVNCHFKIIVGSVEYIVGSFKACLLFPNDLNMSAQASCWLAVTWNWTARRLWLVRLWLRSCSIQTEPEMPWGFCYTWWETHTSFTRTTGLIDID